MKKTSPPIFVIGAPRSGTSVFFEVFAAHPDLAWPSNYTERFHKITWLNLFRRLFDNSFYRLAGSKPQYGKKWYNKYLFRPGEAYDFWDHFSGLGESFSRSYMLETCATDFAKKSLRSSTESLRKFQGRSRFSCKLTGPGRIHYLNSIFPDAIFVHLIRDGRAVSESLMRVPFWEKGGGLEAPYWSDEFPGELLDIWKGEGSSPELLAALQWKRIIDTIRSEAAQLDSNRYHEVKYEDFVAAPADTIEELYGHCRLSVDSGQIGEVSKRLVKQGMNNKKSGLSDDAISMLGRHVGDLLCDLGYGK